MAMKAGDMEAVVALVEDLVTTTSTTVHPEVGQEAG